MAAALELLTDPVAKKSKDVISMEAGWTLACDLLGGTAAMRAAKERYLPKWPKEEPKAYAARLAVSTLLPAFKRTVTTLTGKPFSRPISFGDDFDPTIREYMDDVDKEGRNLDVFASDLLQTCLGPGICGIMVEYPEAELDATGQVVLKSIAQENDEGLRPYFVKIAPTQLRGWRYKTVKGKSVLTMLRYSEIVTEEDGEFGEVDIEQIRVWFETKWRVYRKDEKLLNKWVIYKQGVNTLGKIPYVPCYGEYTCFMMGRSPLQELGYLNVKHWQSQSDQDNILHIARVPILTYQTDDDKFEIVIGGNTGMRLPIGAEAKFVEHSGKAIEAGKVSLDDLKDEMRQAGAELLVFRDVQATATEIATDDSVGTCDLQRIVNMLNDSINIAIMLMGEWKKIEEPGNAKIFNDFGFSTLGEASAQLVLDMADKEIISDETALTEIQRRGIVSAAVKYAEEKTKVAAQPEKRADKLARETAMMKQNQIANSPAPSPGPQK